MCTASRLSVPVVTQWVKAVNFSYPMKSKDSDMTDMKGNMQLTKYTQTENVLFCVLGAILHRAKAYRDL